jgi:hypothetical protein
VTAVKEHANTPPADHLGHAIAVARPNDRGDARFGDLLQIVGDHTDIGTLGMF